jgi:eukaryotic-like serine/threonine-protein kinase
MNNGAQICAMLAEVMLREGTSVGRYRLIALLGEGAQGKVWRVEDPSAPGAERVAKLFPTAGAPHSDLARMRREAHLLKSLSHPSLLKCHDLFEDEEVGVLGLVQDLVPGRTLADALRDPRWSPPLATSVLLHVISCLGYVHERRCVHRDLKPENILVDDRFFGAPSEPSFVRLIDFGIAVYETSRPLTRTGTSIGTGPYMAPEMIAPGRFKGSRAAATVDVFAFGVIAWQLLVGGHPTRLHADAAEGDYIQAYKRNDGDRAWPRATLKDPWGPVVRACLALQPADRLKEAGVVVAMLREGTVAGNPRPARPTPSAVTWTGPPRMEHGAREDSARAAPDLAGSAPRPPPISRSRVGTIGVGVVGLAAILAGSFLVFREEAAPPDAVVPTVTSRPSPPPPTPAWTIVPVPTAALPPSLGQRGPCQAVEEASWLMPDGTHLDESVGWALVFADLTTSGNPRGLPATDKWDLVVDEQPRGPLQSRDPRTAPRATLADLRKKLRIQSRQNASRAFSCTPSPRDEYTAKALKKGVIVRCMETSMNFLACLADPQPATGF